MVTSTAGGAAVNIVHGQLDRSALEECVSAFVKMLGLRVSVRRDGPITEFANEAGGGSSFVGWTDDGWAMWHDDRLRVQRILRREGTLRGHQALEGLMARINPQTQNWAISTSDMSGAFLGVSSRGYFMSFPDMETTIVFASPELAARAVQAAQREITSARWSGAARQVLSRLVPKQSTGSEVKLAVSEIFGAPPSVVAELNRALKERASKTAQ